MFRTLLALALAVLSVVPFQRAAATGGGGPTKSYSATMHDATGDIEVTLTVTVDANGKATYMLRVEEDYEWLDDPLVHRYTGSVDQYVYIDGAIFHGEASLHGSPQFDGGSMDFSIDPNGTSSIHMSSAQSGSIIAHG